MARGRLPLPRGAVVGREGGSVRRVAGREMFVRDSDPTAGTSPVELRPATEVRLLADVCHWPSIEAPDRMAKELLSLV